MRIGILGSGLMGGKLGTIFARAGHEVIFSYARSKDKLKKLASRAQGKARAGTPGEAAKEADAVLLAVHWSRVDDVLKQAGDLSGKVIVSCSLPMDRGNTGLVIAHTSSGAEELAKKVGGAKVVSAFHTVPSEVLFNVFEARRKSTRPSLVYSGDDKRGKDVAAELIRDAGFDPVDAGPLQIARYTEPFALLIAQLAYEGEAGPEVAYRFERFDEINQWGNTDMEIKRVGSQPSAKGPPDWFTGTVRVDPLFQSPDPALVQGASVTFEPGARTAWHTHPLGQTLIVTAGCGWAQREGGPIEEIRPGDVVWFPPAERHWHGATPTTAMMHIAIQEKLDGRVVDWMEHVSDEHTGSDRPF